VWAWLGGNRAQGAQRACVQRRQTQSSRVGGGCGSRCGGEFIKAIRPRV